MSSADAGPPRILMIKLSALGDAVVMLPALSLLKLHYPRSEVIFLGGPSNRQFVENLVGKTGAVERFENFGLEAIRRLSGQSFDLVIDFDQWVRATALISGLVPAAISAGFRTGRHYRHFAYDLPLDFDLKIHTGENFWRLARAALIKWGQAVSTTFEQDLLRARTDWGPKICTDSVSGNYIVVHPGCGDHGKFREWPLSSWRVFIDLMKKRVPHVSIFVTGHGRYENQLGQELEKAGAKSLVGTLDFEGLLATLKGAKAVYCSNTGIMHLASFLNDNVVALHGPTDPILWRPLWGGTAPGQIVESPLACAPCLTWGSDYGCSDPVCLKVITPKQVIEALNA
jgi:ADP-heptose:LPS heptosyltransferase